MVKVFLLFVWMVVITAQDIDLTQYTCNVKEDCGELDALIKQVAANSDGVDATTKAVLAANPDLLYADCSTNMGFCSVGCQLDICSMLGDAAGITGLACNTTNKICESDLTCDTSKNDASDINTEDCTLTGLGKCASKSVCIPALSNECDPNNNGDYGANTECDTTTATGTPGMGKCTEITIARVGVNICAPETCCPEGVCDDKYCITQDYICQPASGSCGKCEDNAMCDPFGLGLSTCDTTTGLCSTQTPTTSSPTTSSPTTQSPTTSEPTPQDTTKKFSRKSGSTRIYDTAFRFLNCLVFGILFLLYI